MVEFERRDAMSEVSQGPGWWIASDGKWYPPHLHPSVLNAPPPPPQPETVVPSSSVIGAAPQYAATPQWPGTISSAPPSYPVGYGPPPGMGPPSAVYQNPNARIDPVVHLALSPWWKRLLAIILDGFVLAIPIFIVFAIIGAALGPSDSTSTTTNTQPAAAGAVIGGLFFFFIVALIPGVIYYGLMNGSKRGQTVGKMALGIAVRDARTGGPIGVGRGMGRFLMMQLFYILLLIPYILDNLSPLWDARRQAWHDKVVSSVVVETRP
jgi:uncharacterized RDD family membrane protein YckC